MQKREVKPGRPKGSTAVQPEVMAALGAVVRELRLECGMSQEALAHAAKIERSHMGKIERGLHSPSLAMIFAIAEALNVTPGMLVDQAAEVLWRTSLTSNAAS